MDIWIFLFQKEKSIINQQYFIILVIFKTKLFLKKCAFYANFKLERKNNIY